MGCVRPATAPVESSAAAGVALIVSNESPAFADVAREITRRYPGPIDTYSLNAGDDRPANVFERVQGSGKAAVIAVGLPAAQLARGLSGKRVVFCQVFNFELYRLPTSWMKGVAAIPPLSEQFRYWKTISPGLRRIGVITGSHLTALIEEARAAARANRIELVHAEVRSDKEMTYVFHRMASNIDGLWLVPDNRVLSHDAIRELLTYSAKEGKQVLVFSPQLFAFGGLLSAESEPADIATQVLERVRQSSASAGVPGPDVVPLTRVRLRVNPVMLKRLGLVLPREMQGTAHAP